MLKNKLLALLSMAGIGAMSPAFGGMRITATAEGTGGNRARNRQRRTRPVRATYYYYGKSAPRYYSGAKLARKAAAGKIGKAVLR